MYKTYLKIARLASSFADEVSCFYTVPKMQKSLSRQSEIKKLAKSPKNSKILCRLATLYILITLFRQFLFGYTIRRFIVSTSSKKIFSYSVDFISLRTTLKIIGMHLCHIIAVQVRFLQVTCFKFGNVVEVGLGVLPVVVRGSSGETELHL